MIVCIFIGILMVFRQSIRNLFCEDPTVSTGIDSAWTRPAQQIYEQKTILELHYFNPRIASDVIAGKIAELKEKKLGIRTLLLSGSSRIDTNTYIRELAKIDWGIEEVRLHTTGTINTYAFLNLINSASSLKRILIWNNGWDEKTLNIIRSGMKNPFKLQIINAETE